MLDIDVIGTVHENLRKGRIDREQKRIAKVVNSVQTDPYRYKWTLNQGNFCNAYYSDLKYLIVVHSATGHFDRRRMLRRIYGLHFYETHRCAILFVLGQPTEKSVQKRIHKEAYQYKDIIQQDFVDSYRNLTWKALAWLRFVDERCKRVKFIIKIDDDVIFNIFTVIDFLKSIESTQKDEVEPRIICRVIRNRKIGRKRGNKWCSIGYSLLCSS
ncbi:unnamed protein product [Anisakis simplex]|uniref:Hexosyltransferase n=1 Tax=Anisakis simplex TaxID=6269 RepID=A0A0M3K6L8_ANISI|nr:unnamed protein product [Anisakis simplex]